MTDSTIAGEKSCNNCKEVKPFTDFYLRSKQVGNMPGHYTTECKACLKIRNRSQAPRSKTRHQAIVRGEVLAIQAMKQQGIFAVTGKAVWAANVDIVAFGCVWIEVKHAKLKRGYGDTETYTFNATPSQSQDGFLAHIVLLICEDHDSNITYHLFPANHPVFFKDGRLKVGFTFTPGAMEAKKHGNNRVVMTQPLMDAHQNNWQLVWDILAEQCQQLKSSG